ncbi:MAG: GTP cyclohydrolase II [Gammaproteobacteria bacterium]|nr:GTP cyclohydrolase II [Gammaproteobacteria bacterium]
MSANPVSAETVPSIEFIDEARLPTPQATFRLRAYRTGDGKDHLALVLGQPQTGEPAPLVRVHSECLTGDALFSLRCDCGAQLAEALRRIAAAGRGVLVYLRQEGRGIGLANKVRAYALQDRGLDTVEANHRLGFPADGRDYLPAVAILRELGVTRARLLTNNPRKLEALTRSGIDVIERLPLIAGENPHNLAYLQAKAGKLGHLIGGE